MRAPQRHHQSYEDGQTVGEPGASPVLERLDSFGQSMPNVSFAACDNTIAGMRKKEGKEIPIVEIAEHVPAGVVDLMTLSEAGWTIIRP